MSYKYTLIISQYYYSRYMFIVEHDENFLEKAKAFAAELIAYKRDEDCGREIYLGDLDYHSENKEIRARYNINDCGDIYFIQGNYVNRLSHEMISYHKDTVRESRGFQSKKVTNGIEQHHNYGKVSEIIQKYFNLA